MRLPNPLDQIAPPQAAGVQRRRLGRQQRDRRAACQDRPRLGQTVHNHGGIQRHA
jgi:hypothetical protein